jgi:hypothetical protein
MHTQALSLAEPRGPACLSEPDAGAVLALACHCVMVDNGFVVRISSVCIICSVCHDFLVVHVVLYLEICLGDANSCVVNMRPCCWPATA